MPQHTIGVNDATMVELKQLQLRLSMQGKHFSMTRLVGYLAGFHRIITEDALATSNIPSPEKQAKEWFSLVTRAIGYIPDRVPKGFQRPCFKATPEQRAYVVQQLMVRLGITDPPRELVNYYLDKGSMDPMIGTRVDKLTVEDRERLKQEILAEEELRKSKEAEEKAADDLKIEEPPAQTEAP